MRSRFVSHFFLMSLIVFHAASMRAEERKRVVLDGWAAVEAARAKGFSFYGTCRFERLGKSLVIRFVGVPGGGIACEGGLFSRATGPLGVVYLGHEGRTESKSGGIEWWTAPTQLPARFRLTAAVNEQTSYIIDRFVFEMPASRPAYALFEGNSPWPAREEAPKTEGTGLDFIQLHAATRECLINNDVSTVEELANRSQPQLEQFKCMDKAALQDLERQMLAYNVEFGVSWIRPELLQTILRAVNSAQFDEARRAEFRDGQERATIAPALLRSGEGPQSGAVVGRVSVVRLPGLQPGVHAIYVAPGRSAGWVAYFVSSGRVTAQSSAVQVLSGGMPFTPPSIRRSGATFVLSVVYGTQSIVIPLQ